MRFFKPRRLACALNGASLKRVTLYPLDAKRLPFMDRKTMNEMAQPEPEHRSPQEIAAILNEYEGDDIWQEIVLELPEYRSGDAPPAGRRAELILTTGSLYYDERDREWKLG